ncbi:MAG: GYD domain-containing protein [Acidobacteriia bacterium]|nr:GYD domain-containing protein [Terriglobia bacterium]
MPTYVVLLRHTQKGMETIKDGPARLEAAKKIFAAAGASLKAPYMTLGRYDAVAIVEAPDDATLAKLALAGGSQGYLRTETLRAFTEDEMRKIIASLP